MSNFSKRTVEDVLKALQQGYIYIMNGEKLLVDDIYWDSVEEAFIFECTDGGEKSFEVLVDSDVWSLETIKEYCLIDKAAKEKFKFLYKLGYRSIPIDYGYFLLLDEDDDGYDRNLLVEDFPEFRYLTKEDKESCLLGIDEEGFLFYKKRNNTVE